MSIGEIKELEKLTEVRVLVDRRVVPVGGLRAMTGVASDGRSPPVRFAVVVGDAPGPSTVPGRVTIRDRTYRLNSGCAGAGFYTEARPFSALATIVEDAVDEKLAPDAYCEG